jgi:hypothetical protein
MSLHEVLAPETDTQALLTRCQLQFVTSAAAAGSPGSLLAQVRDLVIHIRRESLRSLPQKYIC